MNVTLIVLSRCSLIVCTIGSNKQIFQRTHNTVFCMSISFSIELLSGAIKSIISLQENYKVNFHNFPCRLMIVLFLKSASLHQIKLQCAEQVFLVLGLIQIYIYKHFCAVLVSEYGKYICTNINLQYKQSSTVSKKNILLFIIFTKRTILKVM